IERAIEDTEKHGLRFKGPKKESHKRTIKIDDDLVALLLAEREKHLRLIAGVPAGAPVSLIVKLPPDALMFPALEAVAIGDLTPDRITQECDQVIRSQGLADRLSEPAPT